jgi:predicted dehydrogenase
VLGAGRVELPGLEVYDRKTNSWRIDVGGGNIITFEHYQYKRMIDEFVRCVQEGRSFVPGGEVGKRTTEVVLALYQSWFTDHRVALPLTDDPCLEEIFITLREEALACSRPFSEGS